MIRQIALLSNICLEPYWMTHMRNRFCGILDDVQIKYVLYEDYNTNVDTIKYSDVIVICLNFDTLYPNILNDINLGKTSYIDVENDCVDKCREVYYYIKEQSNAKVIWFGFEDYYCLQNKICGKLLAFDGLVDRINLALNDLIKEDIYIDFKHIIAVVGLKNTYNNNGKYRWNSPYSEELNSLMVDEIYKQYLVDNAKSKKCLVLDCDNVLWGGILSENGIAGIKIGSSGLGRPYQDLQRHLLNLYYHGVILAVCSKNDEADVLRVFNEHSGMLLRQEHIAIFKCNWNNKPDNIVDISESLNIGLDSIVFVDDTDFEIESVKTMLPEVTSVLYKRDTIYDELSCFNLKCSTDIKTVSERTITYKTNTLRSKLKKESASYEGYISSLKMIVDMHKTTESELERISELTQRTNKCTNGTRCTLDQIKTKISMVDYELYTVCLSDKFSNLGVVGVIGIKDGTVDLFSLSCRALGRGIEESMIKFALKRNANKVHFCNTTKNEGMKILFKEYGLIKEASIIV